MALTARSIVRGLKRRLKRYTAPVPDRRATTPAVGMLTRRKPVGAADLPPLDKWLASSPDLSAAKALVEFISTTPASAAYIASSEIILRENDTSLTAALFYIVGNYMAGRTDRCIDVARTLVERWPSEFTHVLNARCLEQADSAAAEKGALEAGLEAYPDSRVLRLNLAENLIGTDQVDAANEAVRPIIEDIRQELAEEIAIATRNQRDLDAAIAARSMAPEGGGDIYTDEFCRAYWHSYYESYVGRSERYHGDRLLLTKFVSWVDSVKHDVDVVLDFGCLCAQPLYEAAERIPSVRLIGTDRQQFLADMNRAAYPSSNLAFDAGDIFEVMERTAALPGRKALSHVRTTCTLYPEFVDRLYSTARRLGYEHVYLIENAGFVRPQLRFMPFRGMNAEAVVTKHRLITHNYYGALSKHGYDIQMMNRVRAPGIWRGDAVANLLGSQLEIHARLRS